MAEQEIQPTKISLANTKKEMLAAYNALVKQLEAKREAEAKPAEKLQEKKDREAVEAADSLSMEGIAQKIGGLKADVGKMLADLSDKLEEQINRYVQIKKAVTVREKELQEIYEIEKSAASLAALLELQEQKRAEFEAKMAAEKEKLQTEIETTRREWETEYETHEFELKDRDATEKKRREREAEEYKYQFERQQQLAREQFEYDKAKLERDIQLKREEMERDLAQREKSLAERENELKQLRERVDASPKELDAAVNKAVKEATERLSREAKTTEELLQKEFAGERNVLNSRIEALQQTVKEQSAQIAKLSAQLEKSYTQVQDIAVKAIEGSSSVKAFASLPSQAAEPPRRAGQGDG